MTGMSLKDFAVELGKDGTTSEKKLVEEWLDNKAGEVKPPAPREEPAKKVLKKK